MSNGLTTSELAHRTGHPTLVLRQVLELMRHEGLVEQDGEGWQLTLEAERRFGRVLRDLWGYDEAEAA